MDDIERQALSLATERHADQKYGDEPYVQGHLAKVVFYVKSLRGGAFDRSAMRAAAWLHDIVEDTPTTIDEIRSRFGDEVANLVWAVTSASGKNRKERNAATYPKTRAAGRDAVALKLLDRLVNVEACWETRDAKLFMYHREYRDFRAALRREGDGPEVLALWDRLDKLLGWWEPPAGRTSETP